MSVMATGSACGPGRVVLEALRRYEPQGVRGRREFLATLAMFAGAAPLLGQRQVTFPPQHSPKVMRPVNVHEIRAVAERNVSPPVYNYIAGGVEDEYTLQANVEAYRRVWLRRRVMVDVSSIDMSLELLGERLEFPLLLDPTTKNAIVPQGDRVAAVGAHDANAIYCISNALPWMPDLDRTNQATRWWASTLGHPTQPAARAWARRHEVAGAKALVVTVDHQYIPNRTSRTATATSEADSATTLREIGDRARPGSPGTTSAGCAQARAFRWWSRRS